MKQWMILAACAVGFFSSAAWANVAQVHELTGSATLTRGTDDHRVTVGSTINKGDEIKVGASSRMQLRLQDGSTLSIGANSHINIDAFTGEGTKPKDGAVLNSVKGFFRYVSGVRKVARDFKTPVGAIGIRGTDVFWEVKEGGTTVVGLIECCVDVMSEAGTVRMDKTNTFSKITAKDAAPTEPAPCNPAWLKKVKDALGANDAFFKDI